jgi:hypothetical protein
MSRAGLRKFWIRINIIYSSVGTLFFLIIILHFSIFVFNTSYYFGISTNWKKTKSP